MPAPKFIDIDGKRLLWRDLVQRRREQVAAATKVEQPVLFEMKEDTRPASERSAAGRCSEPSLYGARGIGFRVISLRAMIDFVLPSRRQNACLQPPCVEYVTKSRSSPRNQNSDSNHNSLGPHPAGLSVFAGRSVVSQKAADFLGFMIPCNIDATR
jgi:hypothetical protein